MPKEPAKKKSSNRKIIEELERLNESMEDLIFEVKKLRPDSSVKAFSKRILGGAARGIGFVIGTLVIGGLILFLGQQAINSEAGTDWINDIIEQRINDALPNNQFFKATE